MTLESIMKSKLVCLRCGKTSRLGDCVPCVAPDGGEGTGFGCPIEDCGGFMISVGTGRESEAADDS
jgi:hypothetical protein